MADLLAMLAKASSPGSGKAGSKNSSPGNIMDSLAAMLGSSASPDFAQQAELIWKHLDNLATSDPEGYAAFQEQQAAAAKAEGMELPDMLSAGAAAAAASKAAAGAGSSSASQPGMQDRPSIIIETEVLEQQAANPAKVIIHLWKAPAGASTKPARTPSGKPVSKALQDWRGVTVPFTEHSKQQRSSKLLATTLTYSLQCDAALVAMAAQAEPLAARQVLMLAAVQHVEKTYSKRINASKTVIRIASSEASASEVQRAEHAQQQRMVQKAAEGTGAEALPQSLLSELASLSKPAAGPAAAGTAQLLGEPLGKASPGSGGSSSSAGGMAQATGQAAQQQGSQQKRPLIQELGAGKSHGLDSQDDGADLIKAVHAVSTSSREADDVPAAAAAAAAACAVDAAPSHTISEVESSGRACVRVSVELPGLASAAGVDLEVEGAVLHLTWGEGARYACIPLPAAVDQDDVSARFDKKQRRLVVLLPREEDVQCCSLLGESSH